MLQDIKVEKKKIVGRETKQSYLYSEYNKFYKSLQFFSSKSFAL